MENYFIYDKMNLSNIPANSIIKIKKNVLYYKNNANITNLKSFDDISKYTFMKYKLEIKNSNCDIYIKFNINKFKKQMEFGLDDRKFFYMIMEKYYWKIFYKYISNLLDNPGIINYSNDKTMT